MFFFRPFTIALLVFGGWLGIKADRFLHDSKCRNAGGIVDERNICTGVPRR